MISIVVQLAEICLAKEDEPTKKISFNFWYLILKSLIFVCIIFFLPKKYLSIIIVPNTRDITVAHAAHHIHISSLNIKIQSNKIFIKAEKIITNIDTFGYHTDLMILLFHILKQRKTIHNKSIEKYWSHNTRISGVAPKNQSKVLVNINHKIINKIANMILLDWNVPNTWET